MNTNQDLLATAATNNPLAASILSNVLSRKDVMNEENQAENSEPVSESQVSPAAAILNRLNSKKEKAAVNLGITAAEVETMPFDLSQLETEGIFLNVDCRGFSTLERQI